MAPKFPDASFDFTWVMESSHLMLDRIAAIGERARVLKPGGRLVLCDVMLDHPLSFAESIRFSKELLLLKDVFGRGAMETLSFYEEQCKANGLAVEHRRNISTETLPTFDHWHKNAMANRAAVSKMIGDEACQQSTDSCDVLRTFWEAEILGYGIIYARKAT